MPPKISDIYQKKEHRQHIYDLPDTYIGSAVQTTLQDAWVIENDNIIQKEIKYVPGLYKIFDEVLTNASDHKVRSDAQKKSGKDIHPVKNLKIFIDDEKISIENDGNGIDVEMHEKEHVYVPEMIFGQLLTSTNYSKEDKTWGGKNGYGAKLANIFSEEFTVETVDSERNKKYVQTWNDNMTKRGTPKITKYSRASYTKITFKPELKRFGLKAMDDTKSMMERRVYDMVGLFGDELTVYFNGKKINLGTSKIMSSFEKYANLYIGKSTETKRAYIKHKDWEVLACMSRDNNFEQMSFVNGICTWRGGKHVDHVADSIGKKLCEAIKNKNKKNENITPALVKTNLRVFIKTNVINPDFDTQTKEYLTSTSKSFLSKFDLSQEFLDKLMKSGIAERSLSVMNFKEKQTLKKTDGTKKTKIQNAKLQDAIEAGTKNSKDCILILTEGDSAMTYVSSGLKSFPESKQRKIGTYPLRGKLLNVREATAKQLSENSEITDLKKILGLKQNTDYSEEKNFDTLRYGSIWILTDADLDGAHIKGLVMNFIHSQWPSLIERSPEFIKSIKMYAVKIWHWKDKKANIKQHEHIFETINDFNKWTETHKEEWSKSGWEVKYYKGLGTYLSKDAEEDFKKIREIKYRYDKETNEHMKLAFDKKYSDVRKQWLGKFDPKNIKELTVDHESYSDFIDNRLIEFSNSDNVRSIPSMIDGLKPSQRKILWAAIKKPISNKEIKVAQFQGYVSEQADYHHGETSLNEAIIGMAHDYVGSNNLNLLLPNGQFGTRMGGGKDLKAGKDAASARYIYTQLNFVVPHLYKKEDNSLLAYNYSDENKQIEPLFYYPILPTILMNGTDGIGTGYSTQLPCYNPQQIIDCIRSKLNDISYNNPINPFYRGFNGTITYENLTFISHGVYTRLGENKLVITELPVGKGSLSFKQYKEFILTKMIDYEKSKNGFLLDEESFITDKSFKMTITFKKDALNNMLLTNDGIGYFEKELKLRNTINVSNTHLYDEHGYIKKYNNVYDIIDEFYDFRLGKYLERKENMLEEYNKELILYSTKAQFIEDIMDSTVIMYETINNRQINRSRDNIIKQLDDLDYPTHEDSYNFLLHMRIDSFTNEMINKLRKDCDNLEEKIIKLKNTTTKQLWLNDIDDFEKEYNEYMTHWNINYNNIKTTFKIKK